MLIVKTNAKTNANIITGTDKCESINRVNYTSSYLTPCVRYNKNNFFATTFGADVW